MDRDSPTFSAPTPACLHPVGPQTSLWNSCVTPEGQGWPYTHTYMPTYPHTHTHVHTYTHTYTPTPPTHAHTHLHTHAQAHRHPHGDSRVTSVGQGRLCMRPTHTPHPYHCLRLPRAPPRLNASALNQIQDQGGGVCEGRWFLGILMPIPGPWAAQLYVSQVRQVRWGFPAFLNCRPLSVFLLCTPEVPGDSLWLRLSMSGPQAQPHCCQVK